jgi:fermentation-respiration switch protein FrsA (DUF1100 family)
MTTLENTDMALEIVNFYSDEMRLEGDLFLPKNRDEPGPAVIVAHGFGGIKEFFVGDIARVFCRAGYVALTFDYRGFGKSEGRRNRLFPMEQVEDVRAAVTYLRTRPEVDPDRLSIYGTSFGGGVSVAAAALDGAIRSVVCAVSFADGTQWLRSLRRNWEWQEFEDAIAKDRVERVLTGKSRVVEPEYIMVRDPESAEHEQYLRSTWPNRAFNLDLASGEAIMNFKPSEFAARLAPCAMLLIAVDRDGLVGFYQTQELFRRSSEPKELLVLEGLTHHQVYQPKHLAHVMESVVGFVTRHSSS